jgi:hypothetical protein
MIGQDEMDFDERVSTEGSTNKLAKNAVDPSEEDV